MSTIADLFFTFCLFVFFSEKKSNIIYNAFKNWICGNVEDSKRYITEQKKIRIRAKMTSIAEKPAHSRILNCIAILVAVFVAFLIGFSH